MFKIGDRVKVIHNSNGSGIVKGAMNQIGIVVKYRGDGMIYVEFDKVVWQTLTAIGFYENEIEPISRKGEQLLFSFMTP
jgi:hypothetical protein